MTSSLDSAGGRRGSALAARIVGTPLLLGAVFGLLYWDYVSKSNVALCSLILLVALGSITEFFLLCRIRGFHPSWAIGFVAVALAVMPFQLFSSGGNILLSFDGRELTLGLSLAFLAMFAWLVASRGRFRPEDAAFTLLGVCYVGMLGFAVRMPMVVLPFLVASAKGSDIFAFIVGKTIGRHKMAPTISPNKTWEGAIGGLIAGTFFGWLSLDLCGVAIPLWKSLLFASLVTVAAQVGDLVESAIKRWAGVKDSSNLLPGYGGVLDLADSFLIGLPTAHLLLLFLVK